MGERARAAHLMETLSAATLAMERALTRDEIFGSAAAELGQIGLACVVLLSDAIDDRLRVAYATNDASAAAMAGDLAGLSEAEYGVWVADTETYRRVLKGRETVLHAGALVARPLPTEDASHRVTTHAHSPRASRE